MRKLVAGLFTTLDGVVDSPEQWQSPYFNDDMGHEVGARLAEADTLLLGRRTYQEFASFWPNQAGGTPFADQMNSIPKLVVSSTLGGVEWRNSTLLKGEVAQELARLKQEPGKNINITGSGTLVRSLLQVNLIDELRLMVCPVLFGRGRRLFEDGSHPKSLRLVDATTFSTGVMALTYTPADQ